MHAGLAYTDAVDPETSLVICNEPEPEHGKGYQANELGVPLVTDADFMRLPRHRGRRHRHRGVHRHHARRRAVRAVLGTGATLPSDTPGRERDRQLAQPCHARIARVVGARRPGRPRSPGMRSRTAFTITSNMTRASGAPMHRCGPSPNATWRLGARSSTTSSGSSNSRSSWLAANQLMSTWSLRRSCWPPRTVSRLTVRLSVLVHRAVAEELVCRSAVELGTIDELLPQIRVRAEVQQAQRGQRRRGVDAAADEVPENVDELVVVQTLAVECRTEPGSSSGRRRDRPVGRPRTSAGRRSSRELRRSPCCTRRRPERP